MSGTDTRSLTGQRPTGVRTNMIVPGIVSLEKPVPASFTDPLYVVFNTYDSTGGVMFTAWPRSHGDSILPARGDSVVVMYDSQGVPHVAGWGI